MTGRIARRHPVRFSRVNAERRLGPLVATPKLARELFFSPGMPAEEVHAYQRRLQDESYRAFLDMLALDLVDTRHVKRVPMLVLGAELDAIVTPRETRKIAASERHRGGGFPGPAHGADAARTAAAGGSRANAELAHDPETLITSTSRIF